MQYKNISMELLAERGIPANLTLVTVTAQLLRKIHREWMHRINSSRPAQSHEQTASEAMELAIKELLDSLPPDSSPDENEADSTTA